MIIVNYCYCLLLLIAMDLAIIDYEGELCVEKRYLSLTQYFGSRRWRALEAELQKRQLQKVEKSWSRISIAHFSDRWNSLLLNSLQVWVSFLTSVCVLGLLSFHTWWILQCGSPTSWKGDPTTVRKWKQNVHESVLKVAQ